MFDPVLGCGTLRDHGLAAGSALVLSVLLVHIL
jgi:hypothetical protein